MTKITSTTLLFFTALLLAMPAFAVEIRISAAASLTEAIKELVATYQQQHPEDQLLANFASSGALAKQIVAGAPADIYISANPKWLDYLQQQGLIASGSELVLLKNSLVFVGAPDSTVTSLAELPELQRIAITSPQSSPAGKYVEQALTAAGLYQQLVAAEKIVFAKDVRQALLYAERGEVDGAFVYRTDALLAKHAKLLFTLPQKLYPQVVYPAALTQQGAGKLAAQQFLAYLTGSEARQTFQQYGFIFD